MTIIKSGGIYHCIEKGVSGRVYMGFAPNLDEAIKYCWEAFWNEDKQRD